MLGTRKTVVNEAEEVESFHSFNMCKRGSVQFLKGQWFKHELMFEHKLIVTMN